jgi:ribonuclease R
MKLVEEFMLLANRTVAEQFAKEEPFVYRIHDAPDREKLNVLREHGTEYGVEIPKKLDNHMLNQLIRSIQDEDLACTLFKNYYAKYGKSSLFHK